MEHDTSCPRRQSTPAPSVRHWHSPEEKARLGYRPVRKRRHAHRRHAATGVASAASRFASAAVFAVTIPLSHSTLLASLVYRRRKMIRQHFERGVGINPEMLSKLLHMLVVECRF
jgi:hypothetical protein